MPNAKPPPPPEKSEAFENFENLAKELLKVPKKELDKRMAEYERQKGRKKKQQSKPKT